MNSFHLTVARIGENVFDDEAISVILPGIDGEFTVLAHHEPFVSELKVGEAHIKATDGQSHRVLIHESGIAEISQNQVTILL